MNDNVRGVVYRTLANSHALSKFVADINGSVPEYAEIKQQLLGTVRHVFEHSPIVKSNIIVVRFLIKSFFPDLAPLFNTIAGYDVLAGA